jgi:hypothetical protein
MHITLASGGSVYVLSEHACVNDHAIAMRALCANTTCQTPVVADMLDLAAVPVLPKLAFRDEALPRSVLAK